VQIRSFTPQLHITCHPLDVANRVAVAAFPNQVLLAHPSVDILVNNAGVGVNGTFEQVSLADFDWLFSINFLGMVNMTRDFLPLLKSSDDAQLVNLSSLFGLIAPLAQENHRTKVTG
jgi:NADP-dependent 3-hydroxy acid dehydrogenase YdfG